MTGLLDTLENEGLVRRFAHPEDRRMLLIELTPQARSLLRRIRKELFPAQAEMMLALSQAEKASLVRITGQLQDHLQRSSPP